MNHYVQTIKTYLATYKKELIIGTGVVIGVIALIGAIILLTYINTLKIVYQPAKACDLFSITEAQALLGNKAIKSNREDPALSGNTAISKCGYTDGNPDMSSAMVAAVIIRSGINDKGVEQNKTEFATGKSSKDVEVVKDLGDGAYFNQKLGQLNVLDGRKWIILSYGIGAAPEANTLDNGVELAKKVLH